MIINASADNLPLIDNCIDAVVTDPPYGLAFMGKKWDYELPSVETWREVWRVMKPGAHLLAFGGPRTYHRAVCRIEDAGFEIRDCVMWIYGSGFPKSHNLKDEWEGWGTALKPAFEPIVLARKPLDGTVAENVKEWGCGALNIAGCRIDAQDGAALAKNWDRAKITDLRGGNYGNGKPQGVTNDYAAPSGRWPANVIFDEEAAAALDEQSGTLTSGGHNPERTYTGLGFHGGAKGAAWSYRANSGGASRFFYTAKASRSERDAGLDELPLVEGGTMDGGHVVSEGRTAPKTGRVLRRNHHPTVKPLALMRYLCRLITPPNGLILDPFFGSGSTGVAAQREGFRFIGIELSGEYSQIARLRNEHEANRFPLFAGVA
jgi:hypothetical protein